MQLHHTTGMPDWAQVSPEMRNPWQRVAVHTRGVFTPGNVVSVVGFGLVLAGVWAVLLQHLMLALGCIAVGRTCDVADGIVAHRTGTKSPLGEAVDAVLDKLGVLGVLVGFGFGHVLAWWALMLVTLQNGANSVVAYIGRRRRLQIHPAFIGKIGTACEWVAFGCFLLAAVYGGVWLWPGYMLLAMALVLGFGATAVYVHSLSAADEHAPTAPSRARS